MRLTHFHHSCVLVEMSETRVLFDPGTFSHGFEGLTGLDAIVVTHQHPDHIDPARIDALVDANPDAQLFADPTTAAARGGRWIAALPGHDYGIGNLIARAVGGTHAVIHPDLPTIDNTSILLGDEERIGRFYHPGDALFVPDVPVDVLGLPVNAPWCRISETVDFFRAVRPAVAVPIHDALLSVEGSGIYLGRLTDMRPDGAELVPWDAEDVREF
ncbi:Predicted metal-dependent RNase, consists of a metallo-beta-lactamase domain and an RNA-binding KH domain (plasmid) [Tsukamurella tyrosinosolvens]|uniref:L-ascorbate metabolism protein UlaG, beta-lactamase superfamily n=1 Tax=Tsukamurella tyrosinosolvens TaxID=57704 RepID=A0A1H5ABU7_TSUTY|nr:MBL fold metallo-hydrolase [Tsukamurella tyrosinosolvens]AUN42117.1 MBL fold metallo-hydrolase [Tsukamurella tyrosinosolvens]KXO95395.1 MBL fold metallo-hydrolase [Tsukamurella tyrosinosolvens]QRY84782.1 MBL fold metallo-hydrolase [Tsukamurella tyrosinosolvens]RDB45477.1 MBL fold metallo-hydrolase [Tsukamurella tyrosinosolvens]SED39231.1 L-ascorbate metabolism protein UlaG, beta-lactamase superfamily [Tsukamurella tyrosinosolvens]